MSTPVFTQHCCYILLPKEKSEVATKPREKPCLRITLDCSGPHFEVVEKAFINLLFLLCSHLPGLQC